MEKVRKTVCVNLPMWADSSPQRQNGREMSAWITKTFSFEPCFNLLVSACKVFSNKDQKKTKYTSATKQTHHSGSTVFICHFSFDLLSLTFILTILSFQIKT